MLPNNNIDRVFGSWKTFSEEGDKNSFEEAVTETEDLVSKIYSNRDNLEKIREYSQKINENIFDPAVEKRLMESSYSTSIASGTIASGMDKLIMAVASLAEALLNALPQEAKDCGKRIKEKFPPPRPPLAPELHQKILAYLPAKELSGLADVSPEQRKAVQKAIIERINTEKIPLTAFGFDSAEKIKIFFAGFSEYLTYMDITEIPIRLDEREEFIKFFPNLHHLKTDFMCKTMHLIAKYMPQLTSLDMSFCEKLTDNGIQHIAKMQNLTSLHIRDGRRLTDRGIIRIAMMRTLTSLSITHSHHMSDFGIECIAKMLSQLTFLDICGCENVTNEGMKWIAMMQNLTSLSICECVNVTKEGLRHIVEKMPQLKCLDIGYLENVNNDLIGYIADKMKSLTSLSIRGCKNVTKKGLRHIVEKMPQLTSLDISSRNVEDSWLKMISRKLPQLTHLGISHCDSLFMGILNTGSMQNLTSLDISDCHYAMDVWLHIISEKLPQLTYLDVSGSSDISDEGMQHIVDKMPHLTYLDIRRCPKVTKKVKELLQKGPIQNVPFAWRIWL